MGERGRCVTRLRAAVVGRVSTTEQAIEGYSIDAQLDKGRKYADIADWTVVESYRDAGVSGSLSLGERPEGARLLKDAKAGNIEVVIFTRIDRFARTVRKALEDFEVLEEYGIEVVFVEERIDTTTPQGRMFRTLLLTFAEFEREQIRDRNMAGRYAKAQSGGGWASGIPPFGYMVGEDGHLTENEPEAEVIRFLFRQRADSRSMRQVARAMNDRGYQPRKRKDSKTGQPLPQRFTSGSVSQYLQNDAYRGVPITRRIAPADGAPKEAFEFPTPQIVSEDLWARANEVSLVVGGTGGFKPPDEQRPYALRGRIWHRHDDETESTLFGQARKSSAGMQRTYRCTSSRRDNKKDIDPTCDGFGFAHGHIITAIQADWVEAYTALWVLNQLSDPARLEQLIADADSEVAGTPVEFVDQDELRIRIAQLRAKQDRWVEQYAEGLIDKPTRDEHIGTIQVERDALERELARAQAHDAEPAGGVFDLAALLSMSIGDGEDWVGSEPPRGSSQWRSEIRSAAATTLADQNQYGVFEFLPKWVVREVGEIVNLLDLHIVLQRSDDPKRPNVTMSVAPSALRGMRQATSTAYATVGNNQHGSRSGRGISDLPGRIEVPPHDRRSGRLATVLA